MTAVSDAGREPACGRLGGRAGPGGGPATGRRGRAKGTEVASGGRLLLPVPEIPEGGCGRRGPPGGRATGVRGLGGSQPTASRSPSDASFSWFVVSFVCFMLFNTCYFWILRTAHTALSLSLSPSPSLSWGTCKPAGNPPVPSSREAEPAEPRGRRPLWERGAGAAAGLVFLVPEPGSWEDRARGPGGSGVQAGEAPGSGWLSPSACCQRRDRAAGSGLGEGSSERGPGVPRQAGEQTAPPLGLHAACSRPAAPAGARRDAV